MRFAAHHMSISSYHKLQRFFSYLEKQKRTMWRPMERLTSMIEDTTQVCVLVVPVSGIGRQSRSGRCKPKKKKDVDSAKRKRSAMAQGTYRWVIFMQSLLANNSRRDVCFSSGKFNKSCYVTATGKKDSK
jgi:hypothetical protein